MNFLNFAVFIFIEYYLTLYVDLTSLTLIAIVWMF